MHSMSYIQICLLIHPCGNVILDMRQLYQSQLSFLLSQNHKLFRCEWSFRLSWPKENSFIIPMSQHLRDAVKLFASLVIFHDFGVVY